MRIELLALGLICTSLAPQSLAATPPRSTETVVYEPPLQVCADPNNLPFSNAEGEGFENKLAELVATDFGTSVAYTWFAQRRGFVRETLQSGACDVIMGIPNVDGIATTRRYYHSSYVFVTRVDRHLDFTSMLAPDLRTLRIGVHLVGDDGANTPPAEALAEQGIVRNVVGFSIYGDYRKPSPPSAIIDAVRDGMIDVAAVWGPLAGYYAKQSRVPLRVMPITDTSEFLPQLFDYSIAMGVRQGDDELRARLNGFISRHSADIEQLLTAYGIPHSVEGED